MFRENEWSCFVKRSWYGDWRIYDVNLYLKLEDIKKYLIHKKLINISIKDISWLGYDLPLNKRQLNCICCGGRRYKLVDLSIPTILIKNQFNLTDKKYICVDGKHRLEKMIELNIKESQFYVLTFDDIKKHLYAYDKKTLKSYHPFDK